MKLEEKMQKMIDRYLNNDIVCTAGGVPNPEDKPFIAEFIKAHKYTIEEKLTNEETNLFIKEHIKECSECQKVLENMQKELNVDSSKRDKREVKYIKKYSTKLRILELTIIFILLIALGLMTYYYVYFRDGYFRAANTLVEMVSEGMYPDTFYATIEEIIDPEVYGIKTIKVKGMDINDINHRGEFYFDVPLDNIPDNFKIKWNGSNINFEQLKVGQKIAVYNYGDTIESEPDFLNSVRMIVVLEEKL